MNLLEKAFNAIDTANAEDPNQVLVHGETIPKEVLYSRRMSAWLERLEPEASDALRIACRAQHLKRWQSPRTNYPEGRSGYKKWRSELLQFHAAQASEILVRIGAGDLLTKRVAALIAKQDRASDREAQSLEDVACLVFLQHELPSFAQRHEKAKLITILQRTWKKMSKQSQELALKVEYPSSIDSLISEALL